MKNFITSYKKRDLIINILLILGIFITLIFLRDLIKPSILIIGIFVGISMIMGLLGIIILKDNKKRLKFELEFYTFIIGGLFVSTLASIIITPILLNWDLILSLISLLILLGILLIIKYRYSE